MIWNVFVCLFSVCYDVWCRQLPLGWMDLLVFLYFCIVDNPVLKMMRWWWMLMLVLLACLSYCMSVFLFALYLSDLNFHSQATTVCFLSWRRTWRTSKESIVLHTVLHCKTQSSSDFNVLLLTAHPVRMNISSTSTTSRSYYDIP